MEWRNKEDSVSEKSLPDHTASSESWKQTLREKIKDLEMIASWASMCGYGTVRDHCRLAQSRLKDEMK